MLNRIKYVDQDRMEISFSSLVFNLRTINQKYGSLRSFAEKFNLGGETNGILFYLSQNTEPSEALYNRLEKNFLSLDLLKGVDYTYIYKHPLSEIPLKHPSCSALPWLGCEITPQGNFIWFKDAVSPSADEAPTPLPRSENSNIPREEQHLTFKVLDSLDPKPSFAAHLFIEVSYERFVLPEKNCLPVFIATHAGIFPEEIIPEALEGQEVAFSYSSLLSGPIIIYRIRYGTKKELKTISLVPPTVPSEKI